MRRRFVIPIAALAATILPGVSASSALASTDSAACLFDGSGFTINDSKTGGGMALQGPDTGTYYATLGGYCATTDTDDAAAETDAGVLGLNSNGTYSNAICGTGTWSGVAQTFFQSGTGPTTTGGGDFLQQIYTEPGSVFDYTIGLTAGQGTLRVDSGTPASNTDNAGQTITGSGVISIVPVGPVDTSTGQCTFSFDASGTMTLSSPDATET